MSRLVALTVLLLAALFITGCGVIVPQVVRVNPPEVELSFDAAFVEAQESAGE